MNEQEQRGENSSPEEQPKACDSLASYSNQDGTSAAKLQKVLKLLKNVMPEASPHAERLVDDCIKKTPTDPDDVFQILDLLVKHSQPVPNKSDKGGKKSDNSVKSSGKGLLSFPSILGSWSQVKVFWVVTGETFGAHNVIKDQMKKRVSLMTTDQQESDIIVVFCPITSRVASDVDAAMRNVQGDKPVILVLMHHTRDVDYSTDVKTWSDTYQHIKLTAHVLFHETLQGLLTCPRNTQAIKQMQEVLHKHSTWGLH